MLTLCEQERCLYAYNFFDNWQLNIRVEKPCELPAHQPYPACTAGKRAVPPEDCGGPARFNQLRDQFSPFYLMDQVLTWYQLFERRDTLSEEELYELEWRRDEFSQTRYWMQADRFDRRTANRRLKQYANGETT